MSKQPKKTHNCSHLGPRRRMEPGTCFIQQQTQVWLGKIVKSRCVSLWRGIVNCGTRDDDSSANKRFHEVCGASAAMCVRGNPWTLLRWASLALANVQTRSRRISRPSRVLLVLLPPTKRHRDLYSSYMHTFRQKVAPWGGEHLG